MATVDDRVLCDVTDWFVFVVEKGPHKGMKTDYRYAIAADGYNWILCIKQKDGKLSPNGRKFFPGFRLLLDHIITEEMADPNELILAIIKGLKGLMNKDMDIDLSQDPLEVGKAIDSGFKVNYCLYDNVMGRVWNGDIEVEPKAKKTKKKVDKLADYYESLKAAKAEPTVA
ncbi:MAG: hypothetical protein CMG78_12100 [Marinobacter sp.]|nr:hypothetical protein [Marinobacter sp.]|tara:strand:+ start:1142 stop:1654 length:513 start_codon:yes stop_codon:yes gene_type:complete